jgi:hypothetical protein
VSDALIDCGGGGNLRSLDASPPTINIPTRPEITPCKTHECRTVVALRREGIILCHNQAHTLIGCRAFSYTENLFNFAQTERALPKGFLIAIS